MKILYKKPGEELELIETQNSLSALQELVGGLIECVYPFAAKIGLIVNEEGKLKGLPPNFALMAHTEPYDVVAGPALFVGLSAKNFCSLSNENMEAIQKLFTESEYGCLTGSDIVPVIYTREL